MPVKKGLSYTQRTLRELRRLGAICDKAEKFNAYAGPYGRREDLFNFIDIVALYPSGITAIQSTGPSGHAQHRRSILENEYALEWLVCGGQIQLWSWRKVLVKRGGKLRVWQPRIEEITKEMFEGAEPAKKYA